MELTVEFLDSQAPGAAVLHTLVRPFTVRQTVAGPGRRRRPDGGRQRGPEPANSHRGDAAQLHEHGVSAGSPEDLVAHAVAAGTIKLAATLVRSDSAAWLRAQGPPIDPTTKVAYAMGAVTNPRTMAAVPGAIGWHSPAMPDTVFLNLTPDPTTPATKRTNAVLAGPLAHEGIHAADVHPRRRPPRTGPRPSSAPTGSAASARGSRPTVDQTMDAKGPKSRRARAIFDHLYNSATYTFVKPAYDADSNHFRERADALVSPDGINLTLSQGLAELRAAVENTVPPYATRKADVTAKFGALGAADRAQVRNNRAWRDLVESKFVGVVPGPPPPVQQAHEIKTILGIPE